MFALDFSGFRIGGHQRDGTWRSAPDVGALR